MGACDFEKDLNKYINMYKINSLLKIKQCQYDFVISTISYISYVKYNYIKKLILWRG